MRVVISLSLIACSSVCGGCCDPHESAVCFELPEGEILALTVTVTTGEEGGAWRGIHFCLSLRSDESPLCEIMAMSFRSHETSSFTVVNVPSTLQDLESWYILNDGGEYRVDEWELAAVEVEAHFADGSTELLYREPDITCEGYLEPGDSYELMDCGW